MNADNGIRRASYVRTIDGDTFIARIALTPPRIHPAVIIEASIRVHNWSADELREPEGPAMREEFDRILHAAEAIDVELRTMSFQRIVCSVYVEGVLFAGLLHQRLRRLRGEHTGTAVASTGSVDQGRRNDAAAGTDLGARDGDAGPDHKGDA